MLPSWLPSLTPAQPRLCGRTHQRDGFPAGPPPEQRVDHFRRHQLTPRSPEPSMSLLDILPLEIRQRIWEYVLGGHTFHLVINGGSLTATRLAATYCRSPDSTSCEGIWDCSGKATLEDTPVEIGRLLGLLKTSRQVYVLSHSSSSPICTPSQIPSMSYDAL